MKKIFTGLTLLLSIFIYCQDLQFEEVVKVDSTITKEELYNRARSWLAKTYKSEKDVMSIEDKSSGELTGNGALRYDSQSLYFAADCARGYITYKINIYFKDGRYKYNLHSFRHEGTRCPGGAITSYGILTESEKPTRGPKRGWTEIKELTRRDISKTIESLKEEMNKKYEASKDW
jgi:hypothetical protein